jgi:predicted aldo/keto reductase-like oxidoreductase
VVGEAIDRGVNYFDVFTEAPDTRDRLAAAFTGHRDEVMLTAHLGCVQQDGQYAVARSPGIAEEFFVDYLRRFDTDYVDVLFLHNSNSVEDWERLVAPGGLLDLARRLQREGKARAIGLSGHNADSALRAVQSRLIDVLMYPINLASHAVPGRAELLAACVARQVGLVAMKPFAGGNLLRQGRVIYAEDYQMGRIQTGGGPSRFETAVNLTPVQCLAYVLAQAALSTAVPGCKNLEELAGALAYWDATEEESDYSAALPAFEELASGQCVYCNHCLPCPAEIDVGRTLSLLDEVRRRSLFSQGGQTALGPVGHGAQPLTTRSMAEIRADYDALSAKATDCIECGNCVVRCPFDVDVIAEMQEAAQAFGREAG